MQSSIRRESAIAWVDKSVAGRLGPCFHGNRHTGDWVILRPRHLQGLNAVCSLTECLRCLSSIEDNAWIRPKKKKKFDVQFTSQYIFVSRLAQDDTQSGLGNSLQWEWDVWIMISVSLSTPAFLKCPPPLSPRIQKRFLLTSLSPFTASSTSLLSGPVCLHLKSKALLQQHQGYEFNSRRGSTWYACTPKVL